MSKNISAYGIFPTRLSVELAVGQMKAAGFRNSDISVLFPHGDESKEFATQKHTKAPEAAVVGTSTGAVIGGTLGWLAGIGMLAIPGVGPFIAAGPIMAALAGAGVGGAVGGITGILIGLGIPEYEAKRFDGRIKAGGILFSVHCEDAKWTKKAMEIMKESGAEDVSSTSEGKAASVSSNKIK